MLLRRTVLLLLLRRTILLLLLRRHALRRATLLLRPGLSRKGISNTVKHSSAALSGTIWLASALGRWGVLRVTIHGRGILRRTIHAHGRPILLLLLRRPILLLRSSEGTLELRCSSYRSSKADDDGDGIPHLDN